MKGKQGFLDVFSSDWGQSQRVWGLFFVLKIKPTKPEESFAGSLVLSVS